jgi:hypothetical protein
VDQFNKLREAYKELYLYLKSEGYEENIEDAKILLPKYSLDSSIFTLKEHDDSNNNELIKNPSKKVIKRLQAKGKSTVSTKSNKSEDVSSIYCKVPFANYV